MEANIIRDLKEYINREDESGFFEYIQQNMIIEHPVQLDVPYIFHRVYLHACLKGQRVIADWMEKTVYPSLDKIQQIALRQIFPYGKHLLKKSGGS